MGQSVLRHAAHEVRAGRAVGQGAGPEGLALEGADGQVHTLTPRQVAAFIVVSAADIGEQWHSWQDEIFAGYPQQQRRDLKTHWAASLWPGPLAAVEHPVHAVAPAGAAVAVVGRTAPASRCRRPSTIAAPR